MYWRPAANRTTLLGIMIRAVATRRTSAIGSGRSAVRRGNQDGSAASIRMRELRRARDAGRA
ncbi:hypothetical protein ACVWZK_008231 [Bradyrhizobium sp. GM0.4]